MRPALQQTPGSQLFQALRRSQLHKNPKVLGIGFLWLFGLFAIFLSPAPVRLTEQKMDRFEERLKILADTDKPRQAAEQRWLQAEMQVRNAKVCMTYFEFYMALRMNLGCKWVAKLKQDYLRSL